MLLSLEAILLSPKGHDLYGTHAMLRQITYMFIRQKGHKCCNTKKHLYSNSNNSIRTCPLTQ